NLICQAQAQNFEQSLNSLLKLIEMPLIVLSKSQQKIEKIWLVASVTDRYFEQIKKVEVLFCKAEKFWSSLLSANRIEGLQWPKPDLLSVKSKVQERRKDAAV